MALNIHLMDYWINEHEILAAMQALPIHRKHYVVYVDPEITGSQGNVYFYLPPSLLFILLPNRGKGMNKEILRQVVSVSDNDWVINQDKIISFASGQHAISAFNHLLKQLPK